MKAIGTFLGNPTNLEPQSEDFYQKKHQNADSNLLTAEKTNKFLGKANEIKQPASKILNQDEGAYSTMDSEWFKSLKKCRGNFVNFIL